MQSEVMKENPKGGRSNVSTHGTGDPVFTMVLAQGATEVVFTVGRNYFSLLFLIFQCFLCHKAPVARFSPSDNFFV